MAKIITVSRQFGSGGRELGKRLSDLLGWDYYDREIIQTLSEEQGLDPEYVHKALSGHGWHQYQLTYRNSFRQLAGANWRNTEVLLKQREIIREIAEDRLLGHRKTPEPHIVEAGILPEPAKRRCHRPRRGGS